MGEPLDNLYGGEFFAFAYGNIFSLAISFLHLAKCVVSVGSDSFRRDGAFVVIYPLRPWSSNIGLPIWGDEIHGFLGVVFSEFLLSKRKRNDNCEFLHCSICRMS